MLCQALAVSTSGYYDWRERLERPARRTVFDELPTEQIREIHTQSRGTYGSPRVHAELVLGEGIHVGKKRVERLMRQAGLEGIHRRKNHFTTRRDPKAALCDDLVNHQLTVDRPDALRVGDVTEHPTAEGKVYLATVIDAFSRRVVGWSIADHLRAELVVDALQMAIWRRNGREGGTVMHTDHGSQTGLNWPSGDGCVPPASSARWVRSVMPSTVRILLRRVSSWKARRHRCSDGLTLAMTDRGVFALTCRPSAAAMEGLPARRAVTS